MITAVKVLQGQIKEARETFEGTVADIKKGHLHTTPGGTALPLGSVYAHLLFSEDAIIHGMLKGKAPLLATAWKGKTGASKPMPSFESTDWPKAHTQWSRTVRIDLPKLRNYAKAVYKATDAYMGSLKEKDLEKQIDLGPMGKRTVLQIINGFLIGHTYSLTGEISVLKGIQGAKGYPF